uniref:Speedy protein E4-like n=1 Tax=Canis lupus familiaris TaxID=9615 RepID=A0A8I3NQT8_CANLF
MASCQPSAQSEGQSPQPSTSGYPPEAVVDEESPGPSAPFVDPCPLPQSRGRKRDIESDEETAPEANDIWVVETLSGLKMKLKRQRLSSVLPEHHEAFNRLLEDPVIKRFLAWDKDLRVSDKVLFILSMVIAYFSRAGLFSWQYQRIHFFLALQTLPCPKQLGSSSSQF